MSKKGRFQPWEDKIVHDLWRTHTDKQIAKEIGRTERAVTTRRKRLGLDKPNGRPSEAMVAESLRSNPTEYNISKLSKEDRINIYRLEFEKSARYPHLISTLLPEELVYYKNKYINTIDSMDSCTESEEDLVHAMIMKEIEILRIQQQIKDAIVKNKEDPEENQKPALWMFEQLNKSEQQYVKYKEKLYQTREQRLKKGEESKINIATIVQAFRDRNNRKKGGVLAGEMAYFTRRCKDDMTKMDFLLGAADE